MADKSLWSDKKNIAIVILCLLVISMFIYNLASPSSYKKANIELQKNYDKLEKDKKLVDSELKTWKSKYKVLDEQDLKLQKHIKKSDSLLLVKEYEIYNLNRNYLYYKNKYDILNAEYWKKKNLVPNKTGDTLINSLKKRFN